jgi:four helix bundle protein
LNIEHSISNTERPNAEAGVYDLEERLLEYSVRIIRLVEALPNTRAGNHVAGQLLRSGTSPLPNHGEAQAGESRADFVHKLKICLKELRESLRWLRLVQRVPLIKPPAKIDPLVQETDELIRIFVKSIQTSQGRSLQRSKFKVQR